MAVLMVIIIGLLLVIVGLALLGTSIYSNNKSGQKPKPRTGKNDYRHLADPEARSEYVIRKVKEILPSSPLGYVWIIRSYLQGEQKDLYIGLMLLDGRTGEERGVTQMNISVIDFLPTTGRRNVPITEDILTQWPLQVEAFFDRKVPKFFQSAAAKEVARIKNEIFAENFVERTEIVEWENENESR